MTKLDWFQKYNIGSTFVKCFREVIKRIREKCMVISTDTEKPFNKIHIYYKKYS